MNLSETHISIMVAKNSDKLAVESVPATNYSGCFRLYGLPHECFEKMQGRTVIFASLDCD